MQSETNFTLQEIKVIKGFFYSILRLYDSRKIKLSEIMEKTPLLVDGKPQINDSGRKISRMPNLERICNIYGEFPIRASKGEMIRRLQCIKELQQSGHRLFQYPSDAICHGTAPREQFRQIYREKFATGADLTARKPLSKNLQIEKQIDPEIEKAGLESLRNIFK